MERVRKQQLLEQSIYGVIWSVIFFLPLIGEYFAVSGGLEKEEVRTLVRDSWLGILPFFMLFLLNNYVLVPYFLFKKKYWQYTLSLHYLYFGAGIMLTSKGVKKCYGNYNDHHWCSRIRINGISVLCLI